jgi:hypothetical protein
MQIGESPMSKCVENLWSTGTYKLHVILSSEKILNAIKSRMRINCHIYARTETKSNFD